MKLENDFYRILKTEQDGPVYRIAAELIFPHEIYQGHFPDHPVVPGVCTLTMIREMVSRIRGDVTGFRKIKECKFVSPLLPRSGLQVDFELQLDEGEVLKCVVRSDGRTVLKLKSVIGNF